MLLHKVWWGTSSQPEAKTYRPSHAAPLITVLSNWEGGIHPQKLRRRQKKVATKRLTYKSSPNLTSRTRPTSRQLPRHTRSRYAVATAPTEACPTYNHYTNCDIFPAVDMSGARPHGPVKEQMVDQLPKRFKGIKFGIQCVMF